MNEEDEFYQDTNYSEYVINNENGDFSEEVENDNLLNYSIDLLIQIQDYCKDEAIPLGETLSSVDLFNFIKYGYII